MAAKTNIADALQDKITAKAALKTAIENKGVTVGNVDLLSYAAKVDLIDEWVAPSDWIQLEEPNDNEILLLASDINPYYAFYLEGGTQLTVNWGDGVVDNWDSGVTASHTYTVGTGQACSRGYTTFKIRIASNGNIVYFMISNKIGVSISGFLWAKFGTRYIRMSALFYKRSNPVLISPFIECIEFPENMESTIGGLVDLAGNCNSLSKIKMPKTHKATSCSFDQSFTYTKLRKLDLSAFQSVSYFYSGISNNPLLKELILPTSFNNGSIQGSSLIGIPCDVIILPEYIGTTIKSSFFKSFYGRKIIFKDSWNNKFGELYNMLYDCRYLTELINFPLSVNLTSGDCTSFFDTCWSLKSIRFPDNNGVSITNLSYAFNNCRMLETISNFPMLPTAIDLRYTFFGCYQLSSISNLDQLGDTTTGMDLTNTYQRCYSLNPVGGLRIRNKITGRFVLAGIDSSNRAALQALLFTNPAAVSTWEGSSPQIDVSYCSMDATALNALFTSIIATSASFSGKTIRITGNPGAATCDTTIITNAGGTVNKTT